jgi:hypothetical protein
MATALSVRYSPVNQAYFLMWYDTVLRVFNDKQEALDEKQRIESEAIQYLKDIK